MMRFKEVALSSASTEAKIAGLAVLLDKELLRLSEVVLNTKKLQGPQGEQGLQGPKGEQGDRGFDGTNGKDGFDGKDGKDGEAGKQGVGVQDAKIDFDGSLVITLTDGTEINAGDVVPMDAAEKIRVIGNGGGTSQYVLDAIEAINAVIATYGTIATQDADAVAITGGSINGTTIGAAVPATGVFTTLTASALTATGQTSLGGAAGSEGLRVTTTASANRYVQISGGQGGVSSPSVGTAGGSTALDLYTNGGGTFNFYTNGNGSARQASVSHTASAVNYVQVTGAATATAPTLSAQGSDADITLAVNSKGVGAIRFGTGGGSAQFRVTNTASAVNWFDVTGSATNYSPTLKAFGTDANISQVFQSKGTGAIDLAAGSRGVNISNGGTVTAITKTADGTSYTTLPTVSVSAPTTAGGVQATLQLQMYFAPTTIVSGGTGYTVGDVLTLVGGTPVTTASSITVTAVSGGVITGATRTNFNSYTALPANPVSVTGGTGSGATFNLTWAVGAIVITNAGSGYVEQPTVSFSGGGGSGAAAYAVVGGTSVVKGLGSTTNITNPSGVVLSLVDGANSNPNALTVKNAGTTQLYPTVTNTDLAVSSNGTGAVRFLTNTVSQEQLRVAHTASAVNYVQVTGAATGGNVVISSQGSDTNVNMLFDGKGSGNFQFQGNTYLGTNGANNLLFTGAATTLSPSMSAVGTDTNIDLTLTPKGTGNVRFGTLTASADAAITGYITIKDSGGTVRKLAVIA